jgi:hypothetical protein
MRAQDEQNYYAIKLRIVEPGPRPRITMVRYPVVGGHAGPHVEVPVRSIVSNNIPYRVRADVRGNSFKASVEGQLVDTWSDDRLRAGGVGFFSEEGEKARVYWVRVAHNTDLLGRICALLSGTSMTAMVLFNASRGLRRRRTRQ